MLGGICWGRDFRCCPASGQAVITGCPWARPRVRQRGQIMDQILVLLMCSPRVPFVEVEEPFFNLILFLFCFSFYFIFVFIFSFS